MLRRRLRIRTFVLYSRGSTGDFSLDDLPSSGGRMDLVARCVISALWLSYDVREESRIYLVLNGPPDPPRTVLFDGSHIQRVSPDERNVASWVRKANRQELEGKDWLGMDNGIRVSKRSFSDVLDGLDGQLIWLREDGEDIREAELEEPIFVLGDHRDIPEDVAEDLEGRDHRKVSLGPESYLASHSIVLANGELDRREM